VGKHYKTERARVTIPGPLPRFIGLLPTDKAPDGVLVFSSITELLVHLFSWSGLQTWFVSRLRRTRSHESSCIETRRLRHHSCGSTLIIPSSARALVIPT